MVDLQLSRYTALIWLAKGTNIFQIFSDFPQYSAPVTKFDRHGYTARERYLVLTKAAVYLLDAKDCKVKHRLTFSDITGITVTHGQDNLIVVRLPEDAKKDKGDLILECRSLIEALTWIVDTCQKRDIIRFESASL